MTTEWRTWRDFAFASNPDAAVVSTIDGREVWTVCSSLRASPTSPSVGNRRVLFDELALLQLRPELRRDLDLHGTVVSDDLLLAGGADNQGRGDIRRCGELQRRRPEIDAVPSRYLAQIFALFDDRLRDLVVFLAVIVTLTAADEAGVERRTHHE